MRAVNVGEAGKEIGGEVALPLRGGTARLRLQRHRAIRVARLVRELFDKQRGFAVEGVADSAETADIVECIGMSDFGHVAEDRRTCGEQAIQ
jgi:hypothetical protein